MFDRCYDTGPYHRRVDYQADPDPPLDAERLKWARGRLQTGQRAAE